jgi:hypothetical protein
MEGQEMGSLALRLSLGSLLLFNVFAFAASAEDNLVTIITPADGTVLKAKQTYSLQYEVKPITKADHVHLYVDGDETGMSHTLKGKFTLGPLKTGERKVCVKPVNHAHTPIGAESCITVTVQ